MKAGGAWGALAVATLACGGETPQAFEPDPGPQWINVAGTYVATNADGQSLPIVIGSRVCDDGSSQDVRLMGAEITLTDSSADPAVADPAEGVYFVSRGTCGGITSEHRTFPRGAYRAREDSVFFVGMDGTHTTRSGAWTSTGRTKFRSLVRYEGVDRVIIFSR